MTFVNDKLLKMYIRIRFKYFINVDIYTIDEIFLWRYFNYFKDVFLEQFFFEKYLYLSYNIAYPIINKYKTIINEDDIKSYGMEGLLIAIRNFNIDKKSKFITYARYRISGTILDFVRKFFRKNKKVIAYENLDESLISLVDSNINLENNYIDNETKDLISNSLSILNETEYLIIYLNYFCNRSMNSIAKELCIEYTTVLEMKKKALLKLNKYIKKLTK